MIKTSDLISIVIPTYNRPNLLKKNLTSVIEAATNIDLIDAIDIYISDDSTNSESKEVVDDIRLLYPNITYSKNSPSLGHDKNLFHSLMLPNTNYVWMLGDSMLLKKNSIFEVIKFINNTKCDVIALNADGRNLNIESGLFKNCIEVIENFGWHLTMTGPTIYSKTVISHIPNLTDKDYKNFPQFSLIFNYLADKCSFYWINDCLISSSPKESYWLKSIFSIFIDDWSSAVLNLPDAYDQETLDKVILDHSKKSEIFELKVFLRLRMMNYYNISHYRRYKDLLVLHSNLNAKVLFIIAVINPLTLQILYKFYNRFFNK